MFLKGSNLGVRPSEEAGCPYDHEQYFQSRRFSSWGVQFQEAVATGAKSFLEIGKGAGILDYALRKVGRQILTVDPDPTVKADLIGALPRLPLRMNSVDAILCFEVLEHIPFEQFRECILEMARVSREWMLISVPNRIPLLTLLIDGPGLHFSRSWPRPKKTPSDPPAGGHQWEIGAGVTERDVVLHLEEIGLDVRRCFRPNEWSYHHFLVSRKPEGKK